jgi:hypothetical protein
VSYGVSVTCEVDRGQTRWFLTKESGQVPGGCWGGMGCKKCCAAVIERWPTGLVQAYVIVKVVLRLRYTVWSRCVLGKLSLENMGIVVDRVVRPLRELRLVECGAGCACCREFEAHYASMSRLMSMLSRGSYSSVGKCSCGAGNVCAACIRSGKTMQRFVVQDCFAGVYPYGRQHWFLGVTDGVGEVNSWHGSWLCPCV